jgi:predicted dehydrogenase
MQTIRFGIIGGGLMGREFASAAARWCHLTGISARPEIVAICSKPDESLIWFNENVPSITQSTLEYRALLDNKDVDAVYCAVPHDLHKEIYCAAIAAGKHLLGEKPFGIDREANNAILACCARHPDVLVRCSSQFPFFPAVQRIGTMLAQRAFGTIIEVNAGFLHSSDLNPDKPINWKRITSRNGAYGCMGDLGMHVCHVPFRAGWLPHNVRAVLSNIITTRPNGKGDRVPCETWDNATLLCEAMQPDSPHTFPLTLKMQRIAPGEKNTWCLEIKGLKACARFSTRSPTRLELLEYSGGEQSWRLLDVGYEPAFSTITGSIFEFGFGDALLQMWAAFVHELAMGAPLSTYAGCVTPEETALSHALFTAALASAANATTEPVTRSTT